MNIKNSIDYTWKDDEYETPGISKDLQKILKKRHSEQRLRKDLKKGTQG